MLCLFPGFVRFTAGRYAHAYDSFFFLPFTFISNTCLPS
jgi:hypothetical protein